MLKPIISHCKDAAVKCWIKVLEPHEMHQLWTTTGLACRGRQRQVSHLQVISGWCSLLSMWISFKLSAWQQANREVPLAHYLQRNSQSEESLVKTQLSLQLIALCDKLLTCLWPCCLFINISSQSVNTHVFCRILTPLYTGKLTDWKQWHFQGFTADFGGTLKDSPTKNLKCWRKMLT